MSIAQTLLFIAYIITACLSGTFLKEREWLLGITTTLVTIVLMAVDFYLTFKHSHAA